MRTGGFQGAVTITPPANPTEGIKPLPDDAPITTTEDMAVFKYKIGKGVVEGEYSLTFTAREGLLGKPHTATVIIKVVD